MSLTLACSRSSPTYSQMVDEAIAIPNDSATDSRFERAAV